MQTLSELTSTFQFDTNYNNFAVKIYSALFRNNVISESDRHEKILPRKNCMRDTDDAKQPSYAAAASNLHLQICQQTTLTHLLRCTIVQTHPKLRDTPIPSTDYYQSSLRAPAQSRNENLPGNESLPTPTM